MFAWLIDGVLVLRPVEESLVDVAFAVSDGTSECVIVIIKSLD